MDTMELIFWVTMIVLTTIVAVLMTIQIWLTLRKPRAEKNFKIEDEKIVSLQEQIDRMHQVVPELITDDILEKKRLELQQEKLEAQKKRDEWARIRDIRNFKQWLADRYG